jgi:excisionase family DNA binding protein
MVIGVDTCRTPAIDNMLTGMMPNHVDSVIQGRLALTVKETADALGVTRAAVYQWTKNGTLPSTRIGGSVRIPVDALLARLAQQ